MSERITIDDMVAEGDKVVARWSARGAHQGDLLGIPPTGNVIDRFENGRSVGRWENIDQSGMMQQLGVIPEPEAN